jgi:PBSX family phage portal protein
MASPLQDAVREQRDILPFAKVRVIESREFAGSSGNEHAIAKASAVVGSNQVTRDEYAAAFTNLGAIDPVYDPEMLALLFEHSNSLRQNVDAYATNIDGFGHRFDPILPFDAADIDERISQALHFERQRDKPDEDVPDPTPEEVKAERTRIQRRMRFEQSRLKFFFEYCSVETSFVTLRRRTRQDLEVMGNAYWEVLRDRSGEISRFVYVPGFTIRLLPLDPEEIEVKTRVRVSEIKVEEIEITKRFRRCVQVVEGRSVFFKEFGDPRIISTDTGVEYESEEALHAKEPDARVATELLHFKIHSSRSAYGVPRWTGNLLAVLGSRQSEEVNFNYFENKSIPPLAVLVSGGRMTEDAVKRLETYIESNIKGKRNYHKILIIEAEAAAADTSGANTARMKVDLRPLTAAQQNDALFQNYDERNIDKVGQSFRLPRMLRGDIRDFNRSTADAALTFAEVQVFEPERQEFDFVINRQILNTIGICFWRFVSLAPVIRDPVAMSEIIKNLSNANVIVPAEGRELAGDVFNRDFKRLKAKWVRQPGAFTIAGIQVEDVDTDTPAPGEDENFGEEGGNLAPDRAPGEGITARAKRRAVHKALASEAARLMALREALEAGEAGAWRGYLAKLAREEAAAAAAE